MNLIPEILSSADTARGKGVPGKSKGLPLFFIITGKQGSWAHWRSPFCVDRQMLRGGQE